MSAVVIRTVVGNYLRTTFPGLVAFAAYVNSPAFVKLVKLTIAAGGGLVDAIVIALKLNGVFDTGILPDILTTFIISSLGLFSIIGKVDPPLLPIQSDLRIPFPGAVSNRAQANVNVTAGPPASTLAGAARSRPSR